MLPCRYGIQEGAVRRQIDLALFIIWYAFATLADAGVPTVPAVSDTTETLLNFPRNSRRFIETYLEVQEIAL